MTLLCHCLLSTLSASGGEGVEGTSKENGLLFFFTELLTANFCRPSQGQPVNVFSNRKFLAFKHFTNGRSVLVARKGHESPWIV